MSIPRLPLLALVGFALGLGAATATAQDAGPVIVEPFDAGSGSAVAPATTTTTTTTTTVVPSAEAPKVPDPVEDPAGAIAALAKLYKDGALTPFFILFGFFALVYAERKVAWLRTGYRKVAVASILYGLGMLVERAITGTTPNLSMVVGAMGSSLVFAFKSYGANPTETAKA